MIGFLNTLTEWNSLTWRGLTAVGVLFSFLEELPPALQVDFTIDLAWTKGRARQSVDSEEKEDASFSPRLSAVLYIGAC